MSDYISRRSVMELVQFMPAKGGPIGMVPTKAVLQIPAADVKPVVHGHWEESPMNGIVCSECGRERPLEPFGETEWNSDFCPWCGADMREDKQE